MTFLPRLLLALPLACAATAAQAHPHVVIDMSSDVVFDDAGKISAINVTWIFDKNYTAMATDGLDTNKDGVLTTDELQPLAKENIEALKDYSYFVYARKNGEKVKLADVTDYMQLMGVDGRLRMYFTAPLVTPVDPRKDAFLYRIYDPTFYIAIQYSGDEPVEMLGKPPEGCKTVIGPMPDPTQTADTRSMLATKGTNWTPDPEDDFGIMFAQPVTVECKGAKP
ncbi:MAG: DUF1007 family protein [Hyphomicrobiales bacterium]